MKWMLRHLIRCMNGSWKCYQMKKNQMDYKVKW
jgi:hypothetical protein